MNPLRNISLPLLTVAALAFVGPAMTALSAPALAAARPAVAQNVHMLGRSSGSPASSTVAQAVAARLGPVLAQKLQRFMSRIAASGFAAHASANRSPLDTSSYRFFTLDDPNHPATNSLQGINDAGEIGGFYGTGMPMDPSVGFKIDPPYGARNYILEMFPAAAGTDVFAIVNADDDLAGTYINSNGNELGFIKADGTYSSYSDPNAKAGTELFGLNENGIAVGTYIDAAGVNHAFAVNRHNKKYFEIVVPGGAGNDVVASGINNHGDIVGFVSVLNSLTFTGFVLHNNLFTSLSVPGAMATLPFGINDKREIVGTYIDSGGFNHGFTYQSGKYLRVDEPKAFGTQGTAAFGINGNGDLVGDYGDAKSNQNGFLAKQQSNH